VPHRVGLGRQVHTAEADAAADAAVALFWRVLRRLMMPEPEMARPAQPEFVAREKQQPSNSPG
jgi:hypothetical protein